MSGGGGSFESECGRGQGRRTVKLLDGCCVMRRRRVSWTGAKASFYASSSNPVRAATQTADRKRAASKQTTAATVIPAPKRPRGNAPRAPKAQMPPPWLVAACQSGLSKTTHQQHHSHSKLGKSPWSQLCLPAKQSFSTLSSTFLRPLEASRQSQPIHWRLRGSLRFILELKLCFHVRCPFTPTGICTTLRLRHLHVPSFGPTCCNKTAQHRFPLVGHVELPAPRPETLDVLLSSPCPRDCLATASRLPCDCLSTASRLELVRSAARRLNLLCAPHPSQRSCSRPWSVRTSTSRRRSIARGRSLVPRRLSCMLCYRRLVTSTDSMIQFAPTPRLRFQPLRDKRCHRRNMAPHSKKIKR